MKELSPQQMEAAILWLARKQSGMTLEQIAEQVGVHRRTIWRWSQTDEWRRFCRDKAVEMVEESVGDVLDVLTKRAIEAKNPKFVQLWLQVVGLLNHDAVKVEFNTSDQRSNETIRREIEELRELLDEYDKDIQ